jgi:shikimate kinase
VTARPDSGPEGATPPARIWIVGPMGAGKSTTGAAAALALGWRFLDNDVELARTRGRSARELAEAGGAAVHAAELAVVESFFAEPPPLVATLAASVVDVPATVERMRASGRVVYLQVPVAVLETRIQGTDRAWLGEDPAALASLLAGREPAFRGAADAILDGTASTSTLVAAVVALAAAWWPAASASREQPAG